VNEPRISKTTAVRPRLHRQTARADLSKANCSARILFPFAGMNERSYEIKSVPESNEQDRAKEMSLVVDSSLTLAWVYSEERLRLSIKSSTLSVGPALGCRASGIWKSQMSSQ
jgi:hypothetical protein